MLWALNNGFLVSHYYLIFIWLPYYFMEIGYQSEAAYIPSIYQFFFPIGSLIYNHFYQKGTLRTMKAIYILLSINLAIFIAICLIPHSSLATYISLFAASGIIFSGPYSFHSSQELRLRAITTRECYFAITFTRFMNQMFVFMENIMLGYLMETGIYY